MGCGLRSQEVRRSGPRCGRRGVLDRAVDHSLPGPMLVSVPTWRHVVREQAAGIPGKALESVGEGRREDDGASAGV